MSKILEKFLVIIFCLLVQVNCCAYANDIKEDIGYQNVMNNVRQRNSNEQILQTEHQSKSTEDAIVSLAHTPDIPVITTIRDKETDVISEQTNIFIPDNNLWNSPEPNNNQYLDDFEEDNTVVPLSSPPPTTGIPQHYNSKKSDTNNTWGWGVILTIVVLYCILGWKLDYSYSSSSDNTEYTDKPQEKSTARNLYNNNLKGNINTTNNENNYWHNLQNKVYEKYGRKCIICDSEMDIDVHHKIPISKGGTNTIENLIPLCRECHENLHHFKFNEDKIISDENYGRYVNKNKKNEKGYIILSAIENNYKLKIRYRKNDFASNEVKVTVRIITPIDIKLANEIKDNKFISQSEYVNRKNILYLKAYCHLRKAKRLFRLDKLEVLEVIKT